MIKGMDCLNRTKPIRNLISWRNQLTGYLFKNKIYATFN